MLVCLLDHFVNFTGGKEKLRDHGALLSRWVL
jgi:hypothetical protein